MSEIILTEQSSALPPSDGKRSVFIKPDGQLYSVNSAGVEQKIGGEAEVLASDVIFQSGDSTSTAQEEFTRLQSAVLFNQTNQFTKTQYTSAVAVTVADSTPYVPDATVSGTFDFSLQSDFTLANPSSLNTGMALDLIFRQDATGGRIATFGSKFKFRSGITPALSTAPNAVDLVRCVYSFEADLLLCELIRITDVDRITTAQLPAINTVTALELGGPFTTADFKIGTLKNTITTTGNPVMLMFKVVVQKIGSNANGAVMLRRNGMPIGLEFIVPLTDQDFNYKMGSKVDDPPAGTHEYEFFWNVEHPGDFMTTVTGSDPRFDRYISALELV